MTKPSKYKLKENLLVNRDMWDKGFSTKECLAFIHLSNLKHEDLSDPYCDKDLSIVIHTSLKDAKKIREKIISHPLFQEVRNEI